MNAPAPPIVFLISLAVADVACAAAPAPLEARVEQAARALLLEQASTAGLRSPVVAVTLMSRDLATTCAADAAITALDTRSISRMRFVVSCDATSGAAVELIVRGSIAADVVITTTEVKANRSFTSAQLTLARRDVPSGMQVSSDIDALVGKSSRRVLRAGQLIDQRWLIEPVLVQRGANVAIVARNAGVQVNVAGIATEPGRRGEIIAVRNNATGKLIQARVVAEGVVEPVKGSMPTP
jgi:flagellar basal body P-ring formation protein FlgA